MKRARKPGQDSDSLEWTVRPVPFSSHVASPKVELPINHARFQSLTTSLAQSCQSKTPVSDMDYPDSEMRSESVGRATTDIIANEQREDL